MSATPTAASPAVLMSRRFRGFLPVVVDVETGGLNAARDALLEIAAVLIELDPDGKLRRGETHSFHVKPFEGANIEAASLAVTGIKPFHPLRPAIDEKDALTRIFKEVREAVRRNGCKRAVLVGHNASFDLGFLNAAVTRTDIKRNPFHPFSSFDTVTLAGKHCESGDVLLSALTLPRPQVGDVLVVFATGAYNASMGSNYNRIPRPATVLVNDGTAELVQRREEPEELLRYDLLPTAYH